MVEHPMSAQSPIAAMACFTTMEKSYIFLKLAHETTTFKKELRSLQRQALIAQPVERSAVILTELDTESRKRPVKVASSSLAEGVNPVGTARPDFYFSCYYILILSIRHT